MTTTTKKENAATRVITPEFRISYPNLFAPKAAAEGQEPKYSISMIFPKTKKGPDGKWLDAIKNAPEPLVAAVLAAGKAEWGERSQWPKGLRLPFRDGAEKETDGYGPDVIFVNASSKNKPGVVSVYDKRTQITDPSKVRGGFYARASLNAYAYDKGVNKGITFGLQNVIVMRDGEPFGNYSDPETDFDSIPVPEGAPAGTNDDDGLSELGA